jgi:hypothetical protein
MTNKSWNCDKLIVTILVVGVAWVIWAGTTGKTDLQKAQLTTQAQVQKEHKIQEQKELNSIAIAWMNEVLQKGVFTHINEGAHTVRMNPLVWLGISLEDKQGLVAGCSTYFEALTGLPGATILNNQNDTKLGETGWLGGIKIYY